MPVASMHAAPYASSPVAAAIASAAPFNETPDAIVSALADAASLKAYMAGETVFAMGQYDGSEFLIVRSGKIKASCADDSGALLFEETAAGEIFGLAAAAIGDARRAASTSITAERDSEVVAVDATVLRELAMQKPTLARALMLHFARRLCGEGSAGPAEISPERRVYAALAAMIERDSVGGTWRIAKMPKHRELADRADVDEAEAANAVAKLIQSGAARRDYPGLIVDDMAELNRLAR